jgi:hypothetical protein
MLKKARGFLSISGTAEIWKYDIQSATWENMGAMFHDRWDHLILPVEGIACPEDFN